MGQTIVYSDEGELRLETAGGIIQALPLLGSAPFVLVSADIVTDFDFRALAGLRAGCLVLVPNPAHHPGGDFGLAPGGELTHRPPRLTYSGIALLDSTLFEGLPRGVRPLRPVFDAAIDQGLLRGIASRVCGRMSARHGAWPRHALRSVEAPRVLRTGARGGRPGERCGVSALAAP